MRTALWLFVIGASLLLLGWLGVVLWTRRLKRLFIKAAEYAGYTQNNFEMFARGKTPPYDALIRGIREYPARLDIQGKHLAARVKKILDADVSPLENVQPALMQFLQAFEDDRVQHYHIRLAHEPGKSALDLAERLPDDMRELQVALCRWAVELPLWINVVQMTLNHWKRQKEEALEQSRG